jgi:uncharacterized protein YqjF (DUF2071 family)
VRWNGEKVGVTEFLATPARQAAVVEHAEHRPWPLPEAPWANAQTWQEQAFLHWRVDEAALRLLVPDGLELDTYDGAAWLGLTPFRLSSFRLRGLPPLPLVSSFPELNVRTYVTRDEKPGVWFFSLDAGSLPAVAAARRLYKLPYFYARMSIGRRHGHVHFDSSREGAAFSARYRGVGDLSRAEPGSLEWFLAERYCLYTEEAGALYRAEIHHLPWPLQAGEAVVELNTMAPVPLEGEPLVHYAGRQDAVVWPLERLA